eukprot:Rhum_TRINITY_DN16905_c0_g1::Rhum_TRINITY_DN16905_c0_g1_i1::g.164794::m.164794
MVSQKVRKQLIFVSASQRRLKKILMENGDNAEGAYDSKAPTFTQLVEEFRAAMESLAELKKECDAVRRKQTGEAARKRQEFTSEVHRCKGILTRMRDTLAPLERKIEKAERKGKDLGDKHEERKQEVAQKKSLIQTLYTELEKLEWQPDFAMNATDAGAMSEANDVLKNVRAARSRGMMQGALASSPQGDAASPAGGGVPEEDPEFDARMKEVEANKKEQDAILGSISQGLLKLKEQARTMGDQIQQSNNTMDKMEEQADEAKSGLEKLNKSSLRALNEVSNQSYFTNIACFLFLLALAGVAVYYLDLI